MTALVALLTVVVALLAVLVIGLLRSHADILRRLHDLGIDLDAEDPEASPGGVRSPVALRGTRPGVPGERTTERGTPAHDLAGVTPSGAATAIGVVGTDHPTLLVFLSSGCMTCHDFWQAFARGEGRSLPGDGTRLVVVTKSPEHEQPAAVADLTPPGLTVLMSSEAYDDYGVPLSPYVILADGPTGQVVGEGAAATWAQVADLLAQAAADAGRSLYPAASPAAADRAARRGVDRERRADEELARAGIGPGHPSLYPDDLVGDHPDEDDERPWPPSAPTA